MRLMSGIVAVVCLGSFAPGFAADLVVRVGDARGRPAADAVVSVSPQASSATTPVSRASPSAKYIDQKDETFIPYVEVFRPGDHVVFRNSDSTRHHVYSFSPTKSFELVLRPGEASTEMLLDRSGIAAVGCNIHDQMITYLVVSDAPWIARSGADGVARFADVAPGSYVVTVWHPQLRRGRAEVAQQLTIAAADESKSATFSLSLLPDPRKPPDRERAKY